MSKSKIEKNNAERKCTSYDCNYPKEWCTLKKPSVTRQTSLHRPNYPLEITQFDFVKMLKLAEKYENNEVKDVSSLKAVRISSKQQSLNEVNCKRPISGNSIAGIGAKNNAFLRSKTFESLFDSAEKARVARPSTAASKAHPVDKKLVTVLDSQMAYAKDDKCVAGNNMSQLKRLYADKKRQFDELQSQLLVKQKQAADLHSSLKQMRGQLREAKIQEINAQCRSSKKPADETKSLEVFSVAQNVDKMIIDSFMRMMQSTSDDVP